MRATLWLVTAVVSTGCLARLTLPPAPSATASLAQRKRALEDFSGSTRRDPITFNDGKTKTVLGDPYFVLGNGLRVEDPRDLLPWVDPDSPTAAHAAAFETSQSRASVFATGGFLAPVIGIGALVGTVIVPVIQGSTPQSQDLIPFIIGAAVCSLVGMGFLIAAIAFSSGAGQERDSAFAAYPQDLKHRLVLDAEAAP